LASAIRARLNLAQQVVDFVLHQPRKEELPDIEHALARCLLAWPKLAAGDFAGAQQQLHGKAV
jgi:PTH1 family peptidyl-tRNA hydrolase